MRRTGAGEEVLSVRSKEITGRSVNCSENCSGFRRRSRYEDNIEPERTLFVVEIKEEEEMKRGARKREGLGDLVATFGLRLS